MIKNLWQEESEEFLFLDKTTITLVAREIFNFEQ